MTTPETGEDWTVAWSAPLQPDDHLVVLLHGFGADENDLLSLAPHLPAGTVLACPRAPVQLPWGGRAWYPLQLNQTGVVDEPGYATAAAQNAATLNRWLDGLSAERVSVGGFSQGSSVALAAMAQRPTAAADWIVLSGFAVPTGQEAPPEAPLPRVFWGRGDADPMIPQRWIESTAQWLDGRAELTAKVYPGLAHSIDGRVITDLNAFLQSPA